MKGFRDDPAPVLGFLEFLKDDPDENVRCSVANNLNDIGKDHPELLLDVARRWLVDASSERLALIRHALRSRIKEGDRDVLTLLRYHPEVEVEITDVLISPRNAHIGESLTMSFRLSHRCAEPQPIHVDDRVHFVQADRTTRPRVFKWCDVVVQPGEHVLLRKSLPLVQRSTRRLYPGDHGIDLLINGRSRRIGSVRVEADGH